MVSYSIMGRSVMSKKKKKPQVQQQQIHLIEYVSHPHEDGDEIDLDQLTTGIKTHKIKRGHKIPKKTGRSNGGGCGACVAWFFLTHFSADLNHVLMRLEASFQWKASKLKCVLRSHLYCFV